MELGPLPEPHTTVDIWGHDCPLYTRSQMRSYAAAEVAKEWERLMAPLFDGMAVYKALTKQAEKRTGFENVSDVLDAVVRVIRSTQ